MHHLTCGISSLLHSVNLILFTLPPGSHSDYFVLMRLLNTLTHSLTHSPHPAHITSSQSPPLLSPSITPSAFHSRLKTHPFHKSFLPVFLIPLGLPSRILSLYWTKCALAFVCFSFFFIFSFLATCARLSWSHSAFESTLNSSIASYCNKKFAIVSKKDQLTTVNLYQVMNNVHHNVVKHIRTLVC